jgi:HAD superfamily phosphoserine phosphatase-like hydrolase
MAFKIFQEYKEKHAQKLRHKYNLDNIKVVGFDVDRTLMQSNENKSIYTLIEENSGHYELFQQLGEKYKNLELNQSIVESWGAESLELYKKVGIDKDRIQDFTIKYMYPAPGAKKVIKKLHKMNIKVAVISGGLKNSFEVFAEQNKLNIDYLYITNEFIFDKNGKVKDIKANNYNFKGKLKAMEEINKIEGISFENTAFIGDGENDIDLLKAVKIGIAYNTENEKVIKNANIVLNDINMKKLFKELKEYKRS